LQGAELGFRYGTTLEGAAAERRGYAIAEVGNETTNITIGVQYYEIDPLFERQRAFSNPTIGGTINFAGQVVDFGNPTDSPLGASYFQANGLTPINYPGPVANSPFNVGVIPGSFTVAQGFQAITQYYHEETGGKPFSFNLALRPTLTLDTARTNVVASATHQIFGKQLEIFGNFLFQNADFQSFLNGQPVSTNDTPESAVIIPAGCPGLTNVNDPAYIAGVNNAIFNPFNAQIDPLSNLYVPNRYINYPRIFDNTNNFYRFLGGIRSQITPDWTFETAGYYSKYDIGYINSNLVITQQLNAMIAGTARDANGSLVPPLDFFAINPIGTGPGQVSRSQFETIFGSNIRALSSFQRVFDAKLVGFPFELPGGKIGLSIGAEFRQEGFKVQDSPEIFVGSVPIQNIDVKRDIYSVFGELDIPIIGASMNVPGVYNLELNLAGRYDHYDGVSEDAKVPKISLRYQPIKDLTLRATYSNSFIAPTLYETQGPNSTGFSNGITFGGTPQGQAQVLSGSNSSLIPSTAENYSAGFVYSPSYLSGFVITADYFRVFQQNIISTLGGNLILQSVNNLGPASPYADLVALNNFPGLPGAVPITGARPAGGYLFGKINKTFYADTLKNLGATHAEGVDMSAHYTFDLRTFGQLELGINAIVYTEYEAKTLPGNNYYTLLGLDSEEGLGALPDYKLTFLGEYRWQGATLSLVGNYIPKVFNAVGHDPETENFRDFLQVQDYFTLDGRLSYTFVRNEMPGAPAPEPKDSKSMRDRKNTPAPVAGSTMSVLDRMLNGTTLAVGCNNLFDRTPPFVGGANGNTDLSVYDPMAASSTSKFRRNSRPAQRRLTQWLRGASTV